MNKLFLFDIDKTLITNASEKSFATPINNLHDLGITSDADYSGLTDRLILMRLLRAEGWDEQQIEENMPAIIKELESTWHATFRADQIRLIPGAVDLLEALKQRGHTIGLVTGNLELIAKTKLTTLHIDKYFVVGAYGNDPHKSRTDLVKLAIKRAGYTDKTRDVFVIGDTPLDVKATLEAGIKRAVAVSNGFVPVNELKASGAMYVFQNFENLPFVLQTLGLET